MPGHKQTGDSSADAEDQRDREQQATEEHADATDSYMAVVSQKNRLGVAWYDAAHGEVRNAIIVFALPCCTTPVRPWLLDNESGPGNKLGDAQQLDCKR